MESFTGDLLQIENYVRIAIHAVSSRLSATVDERTLNSTESVADAVQQAVGEGQDDSNSLTDFSVTRHE